MTRENFEVAIKNISIFISVSMKLEGKKMVIITFIFNFRTEEILPQRTIGQGVRYLDLALLFLTREAQQFEVSHDHDLDEEASKWISGIFQLRIYFSFIHLLLLLNSFRNVDGSLLQRKSI